MKPTKLVYLTSEYPAISHTFILREVQSLRKQGFDIRSASIRKTENLHKMTDTEKEEARQTFYVQNISPAKFLLVQVRLLLSSPLQYLKTLSHSVRLVLKGTKAIKAMAYFLEAVILVDWMRSEKLNHVHVQFPNPAATVALISSQFKGIEYSLSVHGPMVFLDASENLLPEKFENALFVRCISQYCQCQVLRLLSHENWEKVSVVRLGIELDQFAPQITKPNEVAQIVCVGRLIPEKGQRVLLAACHRLKKKGIPFVATFVGDGVDRKALEELSRSLDLDDSVSFSGALGQNEVKRMYDKSDIFVLSSFNEGLPVVLMEAMAKELAVVSTHIDGIPELIENEKSGFLVTPSDNEELSARLEMLIKDASLRKTLASEARKTVSEKYNLTTNTQELGKLFSRYLSQ